MFDVARVCDELNEGLRKRPLVRSTDGDDGPAVFDGDLDALAGFKPCVLDPSTCELEPRIKRRLGAWAHVRRPALIAARLPRRQTSCRVV